MSAALVLDLMRQAVTVGLLTAGPLLITALLVGVIVSFMQAITQVQEQTLTFVPKVAAMAIVLLISLPWMLQQLVGFLMDSLRSLPTIIVT